jgi:hypothetical protein
LISFAVHHSSGCVFIGTAVSSRYRYVSDLTFDT